MRKLSRGLPGKTPVAGKRIELELKRLETTTIAELRKRWKELLRTEPSKSFGPALLRHSIAYHTQEQVFDGLPRSTRRLLDQMMNGTAKKPNGKLDLPRQIKPGSELVRTWEGKSYRVVVMQNGFAFNGKNYPSLSEIATGITGTRWNGPRFFGLRVNENVKR